MFNATIRVFNVFSYNSNVNDNSRFAENSINTMQCLKNSFVSVSVPCFSRRYINTFYAFAFWRFIGPLKSIPRFSIVTFASAVIPFENPLSKTHFPHVYKFIFNRNLICIKNFKYSIHYSGQCHRLSLQLSSY